MNSDIDTVVQASSASAAFWASTNPAQRAQLLQGLADALEQERTGLVAQAQEETHLGTSRLSGELDRTTFQLRGFASAVLRGQATPVDDEAAVDGLPPQGHPHLRRVRVPLGPVAMFSASNFPFAFSVLGGDTASALAAGCPVVIKGHPAHPKLSRAVHAIAQAVLGQLGIPIGLIGHMADDGLDAGLALVRHPQIQAVAFTGSLAGGVALAQAAQSRSQPIPFYGELGSVNPVVILPAKVAASYAELAKTLALSITQGVGQFCTSPGLILMLDTPEARLLARGLAQAVGEVALGPMLSSGIQRGFEAGVAAWAEHPSIEVMDAGVVSNSPQGTARGFVGVTSATSFLRDPVLHREVFGPACLCVLATSIDELCEVLHSVGGSLTVTLWGAEEGLPDQVALFRAAQTVAGRVLFSGVPTGVAVTLTQHHGGPWPASTQPLFTSVGYTAVERFLRPLALQDAPAWVLARRGVPV